MIQKRTTIVTSAQPFSSKWWWIGLIRKMRLPRVSLKYARCTMTEPVSMTNRPPMMTTSSSVWLTIASAARAPPRASEPVSPM